MDCITGCQKGAGQPARSMNSATSTPAQRIGEAHIDRVVANLGEGAQASALDDSIKLKRRHGEAHGWRGGSAGVVSSLAVGRAGG